MKVNTEKIPSLFPSQPVYAAIFTAFSAVNFTESSSAATVKSITNILTSGLHRQEGAKLRFSSDNFNLDLFFT
jgi:hypothetical protein